MPQTSSSSTRSSRRARSPSTMPQSEAGGRDEPPLDILLDSARSILETSNIVLHWPYLPLFDSHPASRQGTEQQGLLDHLQQMGREIWEESLDILVAQIDIQELHPKEKVVSLGCISTKISSSNFVTLLVNTVAYDSCSP